MPLGRRFVCGLGSKRAIVDASLFPDIAINQVVATASYLYCCLLNLQ